MIKRARTFIWPGVVLAATVLLVGIAVSTAGAVPTTKFPVSTTVLTGTFKSGTFANLAADDASYYEVNSTTTGTRTSAWYGKFATVPNNITSLLITYKGKNSLSCTQTLAIRNWTAGGWVVFDTQPVGTSDVLIDDLTPPGTLADYVSNTTGTGEMRVRVMCTGGAVNFFSSGNLMKIVYDDATPPPPPPPGGNSQPDAVNDDVTVQKDSGANALAVLANDTDADAGDTLTITATTNGAKGVVAITGGGTGLTYTPNGGAVGDDSFTYTISDGNGGSDTATVFVHINRDPLANDDEFTVQMNSSSNALAVLANDSDPDGNTLTITAKTNGANGAVTITGGGTGLTYTPALGYGGDDTFTYTISDGKGGTDTATVLVHVNRPPVAVDDELSVQKNGGPTPLDVLANDSDPDGNTLTITAKTNGADGVVEITGGGTGLTYTPNAGFGGDDTFTYTISDGNGKTDTASVLVHVINSPPNAVDDEIWVETGSGANTVAVLPNDSDPGRGPLEITGKTDGTTGLVAITGGGSSVTYTPLLPGDDTFTYTIEDSEGGTDTATVLVHVVSAVAIDLCAKAGTLSLPGGASVPIWGFAMKPSAVDCTDSSVVAGLPGPVLNIPAGVPVTITLHNALAENVGLDLPGQDIVPDSTGAAPGGTVAYDFTPAPGTYLYESGTNAERQVPMGLYGALVVRPSTAGQAYDGATSAYDTESWLVLSEIDPALHADPNGFNLLDYAPKYFLINGMAYPAGSAISVPATRKVLLRYLNAGLLHHTMTLLGTHQTVIARDAFETPFPFAAVSETIATGQTLDTIATVPATAGSGEKFWLYERGMHVTNVNAFPGGMLTSITVP